MVRSYLFLKGTGVAHSYREYPNENCKQCVNGVSPYNAPNEIMEWKKNNCNGITLHGNYYTEKEVSQVPVQDPDSFQAKLFSFLKEWWNDSPFLYVHTSGSTGTPKEIRVEKKRMMQSADRTCTFLNLKKGDRALLCMPLDFIAGKMMVVRALVQGLNLIPVPPSSNPLEGEECSDLQFAALVPLQVYHSLQHETARERLRSIRHLIVGGGGMDPELENALRSFPRPIWSTYGMTETLSHIALRRINGEEPAPYYTPLDGVSLSLSPQGTLVIEAPHLSAEKIVTHDLADLYPDGRFRILGRGDNVICSGGIKIQIESVETILKPSLSTPFAVSWVPDKRLGQCTVLLLELSEKDPLPENLFKVFQALPSYQKPKYVLRTASIPQTATGKPARTQIHERCCELVEKSNQRGGDFS